MTLCFLFKITSSLRIFPQIVHVDLNSSLRTTHPVLVHIYILFYISVCTCNKLYSFFSGVNMAKLNSTGNEPGLITWQSSCSVVNCVKWSPNNSYNGFSTVLVAKGYTYAVWHGVKTQCMVVWPIDGLYSEWQRAQMRTFKHCLGKLHAQKHVSCSCTNNVLKIVYLRAAQDWQCPHLTASWRSVGAACSPRPRGTPLLHDCYTWCDMDLWQSTNLVRSRGRAALAGLTDWWSSPETLGWAGHVVKCQGC